MKRFLSVVLAAIMTAALIITGITTAKTVYASEINVESDTVTVEFQALFTQTSCRATLAAINEFRTGSDAWYWNSDDTTKTTCTGLKNLTYDYNLEKIAMQRCAEIAFSYSHTRPDGNICFYAYSEQGYSSMTMGENIAAGYGSASSALLAWREDDANYSGQGHRRNLLSSNFTNVGIAGCEVGGVWYWVQEFSSGNTLANTETAANDSLTDVAVSAKYYTATISTYDKEIQLDAGSSKALPTVELTACGSDYWNYLKDGVSVTNDVTWSVSDSEIASVEQDKIVGKKGGTTTLSATCLGVTYEFAVTVNGGGGEETTPSEDVFPDISGCSSGIKTAIKWASEQGIVTGLKDGTFAPYEFCTRQQMVIMLWRLAGRPEPASLDSALNFTDTKDLSSGSKKAIAWAVENGIVSGYKDGTFDPTGNVTRQQTVIMLWRLAGKPEPTATSANLTDISDLSAGVKKAIYWAAEMGITKGTKQDDGTYKFNPADPCQRQHIATFVYRYAKL